jgi:hypothetical protein
MAIAVAASTNGTCCLRFRHRLDRTDTDTMKRKVFLLLAALFSCVGAERLAYVGAASEFVEAVNTGSAEHVVLTAHLDLRDTARVEKLNFTSFGQDYGTGLDSAVARPGPASTVKSIRVRQHRSGDARVTRVTVTCDALPLRLPSTRLAERRVCCSL